MEIVIKGPGEAVICFIDSTGRTLMQERLRCAGSATIGARRPVSLVGRTRSDSVELAPVLVSHGAAQKITFDGEAPSSFTRKRCREIGCSKTVAAEAAHGHVQLLNADPAQRPDRSLLRSR
jgi:hypothetical protein